MFYRVFLTGIVAGLLAGLLMTALQAAKLTPLIRTAEIYEAAATPVQTQGGHDHAALTEQPAWEPAPGLQRSLFTLLANLVIGAGFGLLLSGGFALRQAFAGTAAGAREGMLWGLAGFASFALAPALGLPPELPGSVGADIVARQAWWLATALATVAGLALLSFPRRHVWRVLGVVALVLPHLVGAPHGGAPHGGGMVPAALAAQFAAASLVVAALFWVVLGGVGGWIYARLDGNG